MRSPKLLLMAGLLAGHCALLAQPTPPGGNATGASTSTSAAEREALVLIGHANVPKLDIASAQRLYTGRAVEVGSMPIVVVNAMPGSRLRDRFMASVMGQDDEKYVAYWTVRKHVGKGTPPRELKSAAEIIEFVQSTPGAVGYVTLGDMRPGANIVLRP